MRCFPLLALCVVAVHAAEETTLRDFVKPPEDLFDIEGTPWILVSEYSLSRKAPGQLSLLHAETLQKFEFGSLAVDSTKRSAFADPACEPRPLSSISPHGVDGRRLGDGTWEIAVVNHFAYESIEFYILDTASSPTLTSAGCTQLTPDRRNDLHNAVSYRDDGQSLAVTLYQKDFHKKFGLAGQVLATASFFKPINGSNVKLIGPGGTVTTTILDEQLNLANGVIFVNDNRILVASNADSVVFQITAAGAQETAFMVDIPDNLVRETESSLLATRMDNNFVQVGICFSLGLFCTIDFGVIRYDWDSQQLTEVYSSTLDGLVSVALIKDGVLFVGNSQSDRLVVVKDF